MRLLSEHMRLLSEHMRLLSEHMRLLSEHMRLLSEHMRLLSEHMRLLSVGDNVSTVPGGADCPVRDPGPRGHLRDSEGLHDGRPAQ